MLKLIPDFSPLIASPLVCHGCGETMHYKVVFKPNGTVDYLLYQCVNESTGCRYEVLSTVMLQAEMRPVREDGTKVELPR